MTQYNTLNVKLSNSQISKLKPAIKKGTRVTLNLLSNVGRDSYDENNFPDKFLSVNTQVSKLCKASANSFSANIKLIKPQLHKVGQSRGFLGRLLGPLLKTGLLLIGNVLKPLAKSNLMPLGLMAATSATNAAIHMKMFGSGFTTLTNCNEEMNDLMKIVKSLEEQDY